ncbi:cora-domain-containing protein [Calocera viscosa TUFC12733]|uniref:Cora-domain-containing protein n=1 Tax=Calocera viscosa (strain TUFC12733) TaxID=1330018 RepID=A0A167NUJ5_CALVF|nr:cora-domain-containing protein [Calocera viscosa TUFC12733]
MSSPHPSEPFSSSPTDFHIDDLPSPRPRRQGSGQNSSGGEGDVYASTRRSPTLVKFRSDDADVQERQRTMDVEIAMQLSRARSGSIAATPGRPTLPMSPRSPELLRHMSSYREPVDFPPLSENEEEDLQRARDDYPHLVPEEALDDGVPVPPGAHEREPEYQHELEHTRMLMSEDPMDVAGLGPLPMYQANAYKSNFDFSPLEGFAGEERQRLEAARSPGPGLQFLSNSAMGPASGSTAPLLEDGAVVRGELLQPTGETFGQRRQRRLSQSTPTFRRQAKLAAAQAAAEAAARPAGYTSTEDLLGGGGGGGGGLSRGHDRPYRFSFYSNALPAVIHARSLSELPAEGQSFEDLFSGRQVDTSTPPSGAMNGNGGLGANGNGQPRRSNSGSALSAMSDVPPGSRAKDSLLARAAGSTARSRDTSIGPSPAGTTKAAEQLPIPAQDENHTWWLDVLCPTDDEMHMLSKVFYIHPLTTEDILMEETREKIELFRNYYLVCFRSFDQDPFSPTHLEPLNMYIIVFREGILSFHFRATPHPSNVRRRIKQLRDYISVTSDWISYALIDDITDAFGPLIQGIEYEVDSIDELVLILKQAEQSDMLRRIGTCRKKVMGLLRLMGNKADVVKGLAKRCNEQWSIAPKSDIGLYLSDIQDHLITMTQNLNHYEKILSRSHSNYLAQISIDMTDANNQINDVLSKLTALGTVLIPMNLITGLWGMNVHVPGQDITEGYTWFVSIVGGLIAFAFVGAFLTYRLMVSR